LKKCYYVSFYKIDIVFYSSFFYNNKIRYNNKRYNKYFRIRILISIKAIERWTCALGFNNPFSQIVISISWLLIVSNTIYILLSLIITILWYLSKNWNSITIFHYNIYPIKFIIIFLGVWKQVSLLLIIHQD